MPLARPVYRFNAALVREASASVVKGLRAVDHGDPDYDGVAAEHAAYVEALEAAGLAVTVLPPLEAFPDSVFVEDPALVFSAGAILLRPGNAARRGETAQLAPVLKRRFETVLEMAGTGFADGGDILVTPDRVLIGLSARTNAAGAGALGACLTRLGLASKTVTTPPGVLHFKTDCALIEENCVLTTARLAASGVFDGLETLIVPEGEEAAANALRLNDVVLAGAQFPRTIEMLDQAGYNVVALATSEIGKIDAGLSCMSLRWFDEMLDG
ncbi:dimethylarginine dimethylaminohydrolase family protein [Devosia sp.]|uniref:dimethylarginine dimethylaminohydrolase family protein n=1 Tax=Devosia sp. TaxID=1871048 RepID=UPI003A8E1F89